MTETDKKTSEPTEAEILEKIQAQFEVHPHESIFKLVKVGEKKFEKFDTVGEAYEARDVTIADELKVALKKKK